MSEKLPSQSLKTSDYIPPADAELCWVFIDAPGKPAMDPTKPNRKQASIRVKSDHPGLVKLEEALKNFFNANKAKGQRLKSYGITKETTLKEGVEKEDAEDDDYVETGYSLVQFWTGANWPDGKDREVDIYNAKGNKVSLGGKKIGNGSKGAISGTMSMYHNGTNHGVTLYLNAIQLVKFVEYSNDPGFESYDDAEDAFDGVETEFDGTAGEAEARPAL